MSQTTNPKRPGDSWNNPKASTYNRFGGCMTLDESNGHVHWTGINEYATLQEMINWKNSFYAGIPDSHKPIFDKWLAMKIKLNEMKGRGEIVMVAKINGIEDSRKVLEPEIIVQPQPAIVAENSN